MKRARTASRSGADPRTSCMSSAVWSARLDTAWYRCGRVPRSRSTSPFFSRRESTVSTVVTASSLPSWPGPPCAADVRVSWSLRVLAVAASWPAQSRSITARSSSPRLAISLFLYFPRTVRCAPGDVTRLFNYTTKFTPKTPNLLHRVEHLARRAQVGDPREDGWFSSAADHVLHFVEVTVLRSVENCIG